MGDNTGIKWSDATWNPTVGCTKVSAGCDHCYAETFVNRFAGHNKGFPNRFDVMTLRGENTLMAAAPQHTFQLLTKRHARMRSLLSSERFMLLVEREWNRAPSYGAVLRDSAPHPASNWPLPNVWLGCWARSLRDQCAAAGVPFLRGSRRRLPPRHHLAARVPPRRQEGRRPRARRPHPRRQAPPHVLTTALDAGGPCIVITTSAPVTEMTDGLCRPPATTAIRDTSGPSRPLAVSAMDEAHEEKRAEIAQLRADRQRDQAKIRELQRRFRGLADKVAEQGLKHRGLSGDRARRSAWADAANLIREQARLGGEWDA